MSSTSVESVIDKDETIRRVRKVLTSSESEIRLHCGEMTAQEMRTVKAAFGWALKEMNNG